mgnify:CR=1 FL=1
MKYEEIVKILIRKETENKKKTATVQAEQCSKCGQKLGTMKKVNKKKHKEICEKVGGEVVKTLNYNSKIPNTVLETPVIILGVPLTFERGYTVAFEEVALLDKYYEQFKEEWFFPGKKDYLKKTYDLFYPEKDKPHLSFSGSYTDKWRNILAIMLETKRELTRTDEKKMLKLTREARILNQFNCMRVLNDPYLDVSAIDIKKVSEWFRVQRNKKNQKKKYTRFFYDENFEVSKELQAPEDFWTWSEAGSGMLDTAFEVNEAPKILRDYANSFLSNLPSCYLHKAFVLLKTNKYFTNWHLDISAKPAITVLKQLIGQTVIFSSYGMLAAVFGVKMEKDRKAGIKYFLHYNNQKDSSPLKARQRSVFLLNPGDCLIVPPNIIHKALVPDDCEKSALAAFVRSEEHTSEPPVTQ